jgi:hypothetical protein
VLGEELEVDLVGERLQISDPRNEPPGFDGLYVSCRSRTIPPVTCGVKLSRVRPSCHVPVFQFAVSRDEPSKSSRKISAARTEPVAPVAPAQPKPARTAACKRRRRVRTKALLTC